MGYIGKKCGIYSAKTIAKIMVIFGKNYGIYLEKISDIFGKSIVYIGLRL